MPKDFWRYWVIVWVQLFCQPPTGNVVLQDSCQLAVTFCVLLPLEGSLHSVLAINALMLAWWEVLRSLHQSLRESGEPSIGQKWPTSQFFQDGPLITRAGSEFWKLQNWTLSCPPEVWQTTSGEPCRDSEVCWTGWEAVSCKSTYRQSV